MQGDYLKYARWPPMRGDYLKSSIPDSLSYLLSGCLMFPRTLRTIINNSLHLSSALARYASWLRNFILRLASCRLLRQASRSLSRILSAPVRTFLLAKGGEERQFFPDEKWLDQPSAGLQVLGLARIPPSYLAGPKLRSSRVTIFVPFIGGTIPASPALRFQQHWSPDLVVPAISKSTSNYS